MPAFSPEAVRALPAVDLDERVGAAERAAAMVMPTAAEEVWRYSRIGELDLDAFRPARTPTTVEHADGSRTTTPTSTRRLVARRVRRAQRGVQRRRRADDPEGHGRARADRRHPHGRRRRRCDLPPARRRRRREQRGHRRRAVPLGHGRRSDRARRAPPVPPRPPGGAGAATSPSTSSARTVWQLGNQQAVGERDSTTQLATVALGGDYARVRTDAAVAGQGGTHPADRPVLRRRHADARLPHHAGPRRPAHHQRPAVQGRRAGPRRAASTPG